MCFFVRPPAKRGRQTCGNARSLDEFCIESMKNKVSFERDPQGERGPGLEASKINFDRVFAFV